MRIGGVSGPCAAFVCGFLGCDLRPFNPLIAGLPPVPQAPGVSQGWLSEFPRQLVTECQRPSAGGVTVLTRMAELMVVEVMRRHIDAAPVAPTGWLTGLRDPVVERFTQTIGIPPMHYLAQRRLQLAAEHLATGAENVGTIGLRVDYGSEAAFSRAFKRATGQSPAAWRRAKVGR